MYFRSTNRVSQILHHAFRDAELRGHARVDTEHLLDAMLAIGKGVAMTVFQALEVDVVRLRAAVRQQLSRFPTAASVVQLPVSDAAKSAFTRSNEECGPLGHVYSGSDHLLLALLMVGDCGAAQLLNQIGVTEEAVRRLVIQLRERDQVAHWICEAERAAEFHVVDGP